MAMDAGVGAAEAPSAEERLRSNREAARRDAKARLAGGLQANRFDFKDLLPNGCSS